MDQPQKIASLLVAKVKRLAEVTDQGTTTSTFEREVIARIKKCLDRANHPTTPESEAKAALRMSSRLMEQYNVTHSDLLAAEVSSNGPSTLCGQSTVNVTNQKSDGRVIIESWVQDISSAITTFFDCKVYTERRS